MSDYSFRAVTTADLPLLLAWQAEPHWIEWWGPVEGDDGFFAEAMADPHTACWMVELDGRPIAYAQDYDPHAWPGHHFAHLPPGSRGVDQSIGPADLLCRGHGSAFVRQHVERLFAAGAPAVGTDPHPDNSRAVRAYQKAGFGIAGGPMDTDWGRALLMERWR
jgi:aminoglycoside 6'-N-acetyltransferase